MLGSGKNSILPVSDPPSDQERERLIGADDDEKFFRGSAMTRRGAYAAISYMACAVLLVMFNKAALSSYKFPSANVITLFQIICSCGFLYTLRRWNMISFTVGESSLIYDDNATTLVPLKTLKKTLPLAGAYLMYMLASMESVRGVNVPMYTTLRRTTVVFTMVMEYILAGQRYTSPIVRSVGVIVLGAFVAGSRDFSFDAYGYGVVFLSNITTAVYLATIARIGKSSGLNSFGLMWCNGFICGPVLLFLTFIRGDLKTTIDFPYLLSPGFMVHSLPMLLFSANACTLNSSQWYLLKEKNKELFVSSILHLPYGFPAFHRFSRLQLLEYNMLFLLAVLKYNFQVTPVVLIEIHRCFLFSPSLWQAVLLCSCILAFFLNYSIFLNTTLNSALTQTICGNLKDFFTIGLGWMLFGGLRFDILNVIGQFLGFLGSGLYAYYKLIGK